MPTLLQPQRPTAHPYAHRAATAAVSALHFLDLFESATPTGRSRLLDGSARPGPSSWLHRVPTCDRFSFHHEADHSTALALDLLVCPPQLRGMHCRMCACAGRLSPIPLTGRHFVSCPHGLRLHTSVHDPVRDELTDLCEHIIGSDRVIRERGGGMAAFMQRFPLLGHRPDLVLEDVDGPGTCVIVDVKLLDVAGPTWIRTRHTDRTRRAAHLDLQRQWQRAYFRHFPSGEAPAGVRLVVFSISTFGAFGPDALALLRTLSRRSGRTVPPSLLEEASWATPVFASFARMSLTLCLRRSLAYRLREAGVSEASARDLARQPAPVPQDPDRAFDAPESD